MCPKWLKLSAMAGTLGSGWHKCLGIAMCSIHHLYGPSWLEMPMATLLCCSASWCWVNQKKEGPSLWDAKVRGSLHGGGERAVRALKMFILLHSWDPTKHILCWLGFWLALGWVPSITVLAWQEGGMWEILCPCHSLEPSWKGMSS